MNHGWNIVDNEAMREWGIGEKARRRVRGEGEQSLHFLSFIYFALSPPSPSLFFLSPYLFRLPFLHLHLHLLIPLPFPSCFIYSFFFSLGHPNKYIRYRSSAHYLPGPKLGPSSIFFLLFYSFLGSQVDPSPSLSYLDREHRRKSISLKPFKSLLLKRLLLNTYINRRSAFNTTHSFVLNTYCGQ